MVASSSGFIVGPLLAIYLREQVSQIAPFLLTALFALIAVAYARGLGLGEASRSESSTSSNPFAYVRRFFSQPRLFLAWSLSLSRYGWWMAFYIYVPIYASTSGLGALIGGGSPPWSPSPPCPPGWPRCGESLVDVLGCALYTSPASMARVV